MHLAQGAAAAMVRSPAALPPSPRACLKHAAAGAETCVVSPAGAACRGRAGAGNGSWSEAAALTFRSGSTRCPPGVPSCLLVTCIAFSCSK